MKLSSYFEIWNIIRFEILNAVRNFKCYNKYKIIDEHAFVNWHDFAEHLTFDEFVDICKKEKATTADDLMKAFRKIDINGDGYISLEELYKIMTTVSLLPLPPSKIKKIYIYINKIKKKKKKIVTCTCSSFNLHVNIICFMLKTL